MIMRVKIRKVALPIAAVAVGGLTGLAILVAANPASPPVITLSGVCHVRAQGQLPDPSPSCTPGSINPTIFYGDLCPHLARTVIRNVPNAVKQQVRNRYSDHNYGEIDHLVSLELGGSNSISNLWPQDGPIPNPKDAVENRLHAAVCAGRMTLSEAQHKIATDWRAP